MPCFNIVAFLNKKRNNEPLQEVEIESFVRSVADGTLPKYQISAFLMAVCINGLSAKETTWLTLAMAKSGDFRLPLPVRKKGEIYIDKHSSGGVGDKTSLILLPIVAAGGINVVKSSGRGLGFTGGTIDKLSSIGVNTNLSLEQAFKVLEKTKIFIIAQSRDISPVDKTLYHIRDVTATVESIPLIASSIMSKKLSLDLDYLFLDVKYGTGAFCKTFEYAKKLAALMYSIAKLAELKASIHITSMQQPLGMCVGNAIELLEAQKFLSGEEQAPDLREFITTFATDIFCFTGLFKDKASALARVEEILKNKEGLKVCEKWFKEQGGDVDSYNSRKYFNPKYKKEVFAPKEGYVNFKSNEDIGLLANELGAGRASLEDVIDLHAGIKLNKKINDYAKKDELLLTLYSSSEIKESTVEKILENIELNSEKTQINKLIVQYEE